MLEKTNNQHLAQYYNGTLRIERCAVSAIVQCIKVR